MKQRVETKVIAGAAGAGGGAAVSAFLLWLMGCLVWGASWDADNADTAIGSVPWPVSGLLGLVLTVAGSAVAGWLAPHTPRPDLTGELPRA